MAETMYDLLAPYLSPPSRTSHKSPPSAWNTIANYLTRLSALSIDEITSTEPQVLAQASHSNLLSFQALSQRSHRSTIISADELSTLHESLPNLTNAETDIRNAIPALHAEAVSFSARYSKSIENPTLDRRKRAMLLSRNVDRLSDILELPTLLATAISSSSTTAASGSNTSSTGLNYSTVLDLAAHIKRLEILYPESTIIKSIQAESEEALKQMTTNLMTNLRGPNIRLAVAARTIGWLRRVAPDLADPDENLTTAGKPYQISSVDSTPSEGLFGALFLTARLAHLIHTLSALSPLRELADQETAERLSRQDGHQKSASVSSSSSFISGTQTERYLKRYIEIFREQSFAAISMFRNIFPALPISSRSSTSSANPDSALLPLPSALSTFPLHLVSMLMETLQTYLPNMTDPSARESLLTQVLYAAGSLGRLGADFSMMIALLEEEDDDVDDGNEEGASHNPARRQKSRYRNGCA